LSFLHSLLNSLLSEPLRAPVALKTLSPAKPEAVVIVHQGRGAPEYPLEILQIHERILTVSPLPRGQATHLAAMKIEPLRGEALASQNPCNVVMHLD
jgi:hypothetical protein